MLFFFSAIRKKMDQVILHIPKIKTILLRDLLRKEEEKYSSIDRTFSFTVGTGEFFKRINELEKFLLNEDDFNFEIITDKKNSIIKFIKDFKEEHYDNVMNKNVYSCFLVFQKRNENDGLCGWVPKFKKFYQINFLPNYNYEKKLDYCHLTEDERNFKFKQRNVKKFDFLSIFFKEEYYYNKQYNIPTNHIIWFKRNIFNDIRRKCCSGNFVCPSDEECHGHKFIKFVEKLFEAITYGVMEKKVYYKYFLFNNFEKKNEEIFRWDFIPSEPKDLSNFSFSRRLSFLN